MAGCATCASELRPGAKFCDQCGTPAALACVACGSELRPGARFCDECGASQAGAASSPARVIPSAVSQEPVQVTERKVTSVLFGDLVSYTTLSEQRDMDEIREMLSAYYTRCRQIVSRYGGEIGKFIGDAVMAVWGVPVAHEDDAERAVRAGLELVRAVETLGEEIGIPQLALRVGIVTGEVAVTQTATFEGMVAGDAVNTAARVQSVASPGQVWVDESTRLLASGAITFDDVGSHQLKGKAEPVPLWEVRAVVAAIGGAQRADGLEAPLIGRDRELRLLKELFHGVEETGRPALVLVNGDAGLGKSRLAWEFEKYVDGLATEVGWHTTRCLAYGDGVAFWPIAEAVRGRLGLVESDSETDPAAALDSWLLRAVPDEAEAAWLRPRLLALVGPAGSGDYDRDDLFAAWTTFFERAREHRAAVVLVIDDAQHADDGTMHFVEHVLASSEAPLFVLMLARPGLLQQWPELATNRRTTVLHLADLEPREMANLLDGLVSGLPVTVRDGLVERAEGVPLYAMETIRSLIDRDLVVPRGGVYVLPDADSLDLASIGAPASLQALVAARLDGLPKPERRVVADASVLGMSFTRGAIEALASDVPDLDGVLSALTRAEILGTVGSRLSSEFGQYRFVQQVVRQVAYATQSRRDRKGRHLAVAVHYRSLPDPGGEYAPLLAQHYLDAIEASSQTDEDLAALRESAVEQLRRAAGRARSLGAAGDALRYLDSALTYVDDPQGASLHLDAAWAAVDLGDADRADLHARAALALYTQAGDVINAGEAAAALANAYGRLRAEGAAALEVAMPHWEALHDVPGAGPALLALGDAISYAEQGLNLDTVPTCLARVRIADAVGDRPALAEAMIVLGTSHMRSAPNFASALLRGAFDIARTGQRPRAMLRSLINLGVLTADSDLDESISSLESALDAGRKSGLTVMLRSSVLLNLALTNLARGTWDEADRWLDDLPPTPMTHFMRPLIDAALAEARGAERRYPTVEHEARVTDDLTFLAYLEATEMFEAQARGHLAAAVENAVRAISMYVEVFGISDDAMYLWPPAVDAALQARDEEALAKLLAFVDDSPPGLVSAAMNAHRHRFGGLIAMRRDEPQAEAELREAIAGFEAWGSRSYAARTRLELAQHLDAQGRADEAGEARALGLTALESAGANGWLRQLGVERETSPVS